MEKDIEKGLDLTYNVFKCKNLRFSNNLVSLDLTYNVFKWVIYVETCPPWVSLDLTYNVFKY